MATLTDEDTGKKISIDPESVIFVQHHIDGTTSIGIKGGKIIYVSDDKDTVLRELGRI